MKAIAQIQTLGIIIALLPKIGHAEKKLIHPNGSAVTVRVQSDGTYVNCAGAVIRVDLNAGDVVKDSTDTCPVVRERKKTPYTEFFTPGRPLLPNGRIIDATRIAVVHSAARQ